MKSPGRSAEAATIQFFRRGGRPLVVKVPVALELERLGVRVDRLLAIGALVVRLEVVEG